MVLARLAVVLATVLAREPGAADSILESVDRLGEQLRSRDLDGALLAAHRRTGAAARLAGMWEQTHHDAVDARDSELASLCAFGAGIVHLRLGQASEALQAFSRAGQEHEHDVVIRAGVLLALHQQQRWPEVNLALEDLSEHVSGDAAVDLLRLAAHLAVARADHPRQAITLLDRVLEHCRRYTRKELSEKCQQAGFEVTELISFNRVSVLPWLFNSRVLRRRNFGKLQLKLFDSFIWLWRRLDRFVPLPGLSLIAVARKPAASSSR